MISTVRTPLEAFREASSVLRAKGVEEPEKETELLFSEILGISRELLYTSDRDLTDKQITVLSRAIERRIKGEPLQYIIGYVEFYGLRFYVGKGVLIPRPETELLVQEVLKLVDDGFLKRDIGILDIGTGSGCIAISLAYRLKEADVIGTDISQEALQYAEKNRLYHALSNVSFIRADLFPEQKRRFDLIVSNPPYVSKEEMEHLELHVKKEPREALYGGVDGLEFYKRIMSGAREVLEKDGIIVLESGAGQRKAIEGIAREKGFDLFDVEKDLAGIDRVLVFKSE
ncbi:MAG: peptide chain release factor N(5)-glutamine methyltransferase [Nitrospirae bacterium]|nr:peptide chain release factor N(5)-glutamine methyltransferase [Nitrospirota bacterium]